MFRDDLSLTVSVLSPLHVGSGAIEIQTFDEGTKSEASAEVSLLQRSSSRAPWLPGSTLKGALSDLALDIGIKSAIDLFGTGGATEGAETGGQRGCLTVYGADSENAETFSERRNAIHSGTGASKKNYLFAKEMVDVGSGFLLRLRLETIGTRQRDDLLADVTRLLSCFAATNGHALGSSKSAFFGRLKLASPIICRSQSFSKTGWSAETQSEIRVADVNVTKETILNMSCPGPYLAKGGVRVELIPNARRTQGNDDTKEVTFPARFPAKTHKTATLSKGRAPRAPRLAGSGVKGAMLKRAQWLVRLAELRGEDEEYVAVQTSAGERQLGVVQRVFGGEGYRARLNISVTNIASKGVSRHPSIRLDPITQAPYKGALFEIEADFGISFDLGLSWFKPPRNDEQELLELLRQDIDQNGLKLGMGTTKGFGWFNCEPSDFSASYQRKLEKERKSLPDKVAELRKSVAKQLPSSQVTLPYRMLPIDLECVGMPEPEVSESWKSASLHVAPLPDGLSGHIDLDWVFDTALLIGNGGETRGPQSYGSAQSRQFYLPGSTLKGYVRNVLAAAVNARITHPNDAELSEEEIKQGRRTFPLEGPLKQLLENSTASHDNPHRPLLNSEFSPDFVQALLGYIEEPCSARGALSHEMSHLKSRVSFGFAKLKSDFQLSVPRETVFAEPKPTAAFYDHIGVKRYVPGAGGSKQAFDRLPLKEQGTDGMGSRVTFLQPSQNGGVLTFRGRIAFHNLSSAELGGLFWVLLGGGRDSSRHYLGQGRPFGFGRCFCAGLDVHLAGNSSRQMPEVSEAVASLFSAQGNDFLPMYQAFLGYLSSIGRAPGQNSAIDALLYSFDPAYGQLLRNDGKLAAQDPGYQTASTFTGLRDERGNTNYDEGMEEEGKKAIAQSRQFNNGGLAALLRNKP